MTDFARPVISLPSERRNRISRTVMFQTDNPFDRPVAPEVSSRPGNSFPRRNLRRCRQIRRVQAQINRLIADLSAAPSTAWARTCRVLLRSAADLLQSAMQSDPQCQDLPAVTGANSRIR